MRVPRALRTSWVPLIILVPLLILAIWITVEHVRSRDQNREPVIARCERYGPSEQGVRCYEDYLTGMLAERGAPAALRRARQLEQTSGIVRIYCHSIVHTLGRLAYERYGTLRATLEHGEMVCFAGYYHGAIRAGLANAADYGSAVRDACPFNLEHDGGFKFYQCLHGLGHGVTVFRHNHVGQALADCDLLPTAWQRESCHGGVFMELIDAKFVHAVQGHAAHSGMPSPHAHASVRDGFADDGTDFWPCFSVAEVYRPPCFGISTARVLALHGRDFNHLIEACERLEESRYRMICFRSYGRDAAGVGLGTTFGEINNLCDAVPPDMRGVCYETAAAVVATHYADPKKADPICRRAGAFRSHCAAGARLVAISLGIDHGRR